MLYFADSRWWAWHRERPELKAFAGEIASIESSGAEVTEERVHLLRQWGPTQVSADPEALGTGQNSGFQALNLALLAGALKVILLGYDMRYDGGRSHWHEGHPIKTGEDSYRQYSRFFSEFLTALAGPFAGARIINATPGSLISCFPRASLTEALVS